MSTEGNSYQEKKGHLSIFKKNRNKASEDYDRFQYSDTLIAILNPRGYIQHISPPLEKELSYRNNRIKGSNVFRYIHKQDLKAVFNEISSYKSLYKKNQPQNKKAGDKLSFSHRLELRLIDGTGQKIWFETIFTMNNYNVYCILKNITDKKQPQEKNSPSGGIPEVFLNALEDPVCVKNQNLKYHTVNNAACRFYGLEPDKILNRTDFDFFTQDEADMFQADDRKVLETGEPVKKEYPIHIGENLFTVLIKKSLYTDPVRNDKFIITLYMDISDKKESEGEQNNKFPGLKESPADNKQALLEILQAENNKLENLLEGLAQTGIGINIINNKFELLYQNKALDALFDPIDNCPCHLKYWQKDKQCSGCNFLEAIKTNEIRVKIIEHPNGKSYKVIFIPFPASDPRPAKAMGVYIDITDKQKMELSRRELQAKLTSAERLQSVGILAGGVAHDLNNIMAALVGYPDLLLHELPEDSPLREPLLTIKDSGNRAAAVVQDLLTLSRKGFKKASIINLNEVIKKYQASLEFTRTKTEYSNINFEFNPTEDLLNIEGSNIHLTKILMNIIGNAAEVIGNRGTITISTSNITLSEPLHGFETVGTGEYVRLTITDTGKGISREDIQKIFEPFYTKKVMGLKSGSGLGLAVVKAAVKDHKGFIDVQSREGSGTTFEFYFPATTEKVMNQIKETELLKLMGTGEKILVIDDRLDQRKIASKFLSRLGYFVMTVQGGNEGIEYLKNHKADLVLIDIILEPGPDGLTTYKEIMKINPRQKAVFISGFSDDNQMRKVKEAAAVGYIKKPYTIMSLGKAVKTALHKNS